MMIFLKEEVLDSMLIALLLAGRISEILRFVMQ